MPPGRIELGKGKEQPFVLETSLSGLQRQRGELDRQALKLHREIERTRLKHGAYSNAGEARKRKQRLAKRLEDMNTAYNLITRRLERVDAKLNELLIKVPKTPN